MRHITCECSQRQRRAPTLAQGNALGLHRKTNPSPERARQRIPQLRIGIGTPFQGLVKYLHGETQGVALG